MGLARQIRRLRKIREVTSSRKRRKALLEPLEPRLLLDGDLTFPTAGPNDLTLKLNSAGDQLQIINDTSVVVDWLALSGATAVNIVGSEYDDVLRVDLDLDSLLNSLSITFHGGSGDDSAIIADDLILYGGDLIIDAETITVNPDVTISTRQIAASGNPLTAFSTGDSGDIEFTGETISVGLGAALLAQADNTFQSGNITLEAKSTVELRPYTPLDPLLFGTENAETKIELIGVTLKGKTVEVTATADTSKTTTEEDEPFTQALVDAGLLNFSEIFNWSSSKATAEVKVGAGTDIQADTDVLLSANATSESVITTIGFGLGFTYAESEAISKAYVEGGGKVSAGSKLTVKSETTNTVEASAYGVSQGPSINFALSDTTSNADAYIANGATIGATTLDVNATITNTIETKAEPFEISGGSKGLAIAISNLTSTANAYIDAEVSIPGNVNITATNTTENKTSANAEPKSSFSGVVDIYNEAPKVWDALKSYFSDKDKKPDEKTQSSDEKPKAFDVSAAVAVAEASNTTNAYIGSDAVVRSGGSVLVTSTIEDDFRTLAVSDAEEANTVISASVAVAKTVDTANAYIADGAEVSAATLIDVNAVTTVPNPVDGFKESLPSDFWGWFQTASDLEGFLQDAVTSYVRSAAQANDDTGKFALSGSVNIVAFENTANAYIGAGAKINQNSTYTPSDDQTVKVRAKNTVKTINLAGVLGFIDPTSGWVEDGSFNKDKLTEFYGTSGKASLGGTYNQIRYKTTTQAVIKNGAEVHAEKEVIVEATSDQFDFLLAVAGGQAEKFGISGAVSYAKQDSLTLAQVESGAHITTGNLSITAEDTTKHINVTGGVMIGKQVGIDGSVGINEINRETHAVIGNFQGQKGGPWEFTFNQNGDRGLIEAAGDADFLGTLTPSPVTEGDPGTQEVQRIDNTSTAGSFRLSFGGQTTGSIAYDATAAEVEKALNELASIQAAGGVKVTVAPGGDPSSDTVNVSGNVAVSATSTGNIYVFSLAASVITPGSDEPGGGGQQPPEGEEPEEPQAELETEDPLDGETLPKLFGDAEGAPTEDESGNPTEPSKGQGKTGIGIAGDVSIITLNDSAMAYINDQGKATSQTLTLTSTNDTNLIAAAGAAAVTTTDGLSVGIAGSFSKVVLEGETRSFITGATLDVDETYAQSQPAATPALKLDANRTGDVLTVTAGLGVTPKKKGIAIAGSVSLTKIENDTETWLDRVNATVGGQILLNSLDDSEMLSIAGSISYGGKAGIGAAVGINKIYNTTRSTIRGSTLQHDGTLTLQGFNDNEIISAAAGLAASGDMLGASGMVSVNFIDNTAEASISRSTNRVNSLQPNGAISLWAKDDSLIMSLAGSVAGAKKAGIGGAVAYNSIENTITAFADRSNLQTSGGLSLKAESLETIKTISAAGAGAEKFSLAGAVSLNFMESTIDARISNSADIDAAGTVSVTATDDSTIGAITGSVAGAGKVTIGASVAYNKIANEVLAHIDASNVASLQGNVVVNAGEAADVTSIAAGGVGAGKFALGGSVTINEIGTETNKHTTRASIGDGSIIEADGSVVVAAHDGLDMLLVAGVLGGAGSAAIGASNTTVITHNLVESSVGDAQVTARGKQTPVLVAAAEKDVNGNRVTESVTGLAVTATSYEDIQSFAIAGVGAGKFALAGSATVNVLNETTKAFIGQGALINEDTTGAAGSQGVRVVAYDDTDLLSVAGALSGAGQFALGAGADVAVITKDTQAYVWAEELNARGDIKVQADSSEDFCSISASLGGAGTLAIAGSAGVYVLNITTRAFIGDDPADLIALTGSTTVRAGGSVLVSAADNTEADVIAGNIAGAGTAGIGISGAVAVVTKNTQAFLGPNADVTGEGGGDGVLAHTGEFTIGSVADSGSDDFAGLPAAQINQVDGDTDTITLSAPHGFTTGQALVYTKGTSAINIEGGTLENGQTYYVIVVDDNTIKLAATEDDAYDDKPINLLASTLVGTHTLTDGIPTAPHAEVTAPGQQLSADADTDFDGDGDSDLSPDASKQTTQRTSVAGTATVKGVAITAINKDNLETIGVSGGGAGTFAANIGGSVNVIESNTAAFVASGAAVNRDTDITDATTSEQSVLVAAGNDLYHMGIGGAISLAGAAAITPGADVTVITNDTRAYIDNGALVKAEKDIRVTANAKEDFLSIAAGVGGAGTVGIGVAAGVLVMNNTTSAYIGDDPNRLKDDVDATGPGDGTSTDPSGLKGAVAWAGGNVLVAAKDTTETLTVAGSLGVGLGAAGVGGAAGVTVITKDTQAFVGDHAVVEARGKGGTLTGVLDGTNNNDKDDAGSTGFGTETGFRGVAVQAQSSENLFVIGASAGGGLYVGLAGGVTVEVIDSDTGAWIGGHAVVSAENGDPDASVNVTAANDFSIFSLGGGLGLGAAGIAGGVDVGSLRNDTTAYIGDYADVRASHDVDINALSRKDIDSFGVSVGAGLGGISGSVSVWSIGSGLNGTYSYTEKDGDGNDGDTQSETVVTADGLKSILSSEEDKADGDEGDPAGEFSKNLGGYPSSQNTLNDGTPDNGKLLSEKMGSAGDEISGDTSDSLIGDSMAGVTTAGTTAYVGTGATVAAGDDVNIRAIDRLDFDVVVGSVALGGIGLGGSVAVLNVDNSVQAFISAEATVNAGTETTDDILVHAESVEDLWGLAIAGQVSAGLSLGAQVIVFNDNSNQTAFIGFPVTDEANRATIDQAGGTVTVEAKADRTIDAEPYGGGISLGGSAGASVAIVDVGGATKAYIDDAEIGQSTGSVGNVRVLAESVADVDLYCLAVSGGILFGASGAIALGDYTPTIEASIRSDSDITVKYDVTVESHSRADIDTEALGVNIGGLAAVGASVTIATNSPTLTTFIGNATVTAKEGDITLRSLSNYDATGANKLDQGADAYATAGSGSLVLGAAGSYTEANGSANLETYVAAGATIKAGADFSLLSKSYNKAVASSEAVGVGLGLGAGVSLARANNSGLNLAHFDGASLTGQTVSIMAETVDYANAYTMAGAGALLGSGVGGDSKSVVNSKTKAYVGSGADIRAFNSFLLSAEETPEAIANSEGVSVGLGLSVGVSLSDAQTTPEVRSYIAPNSNIVTGIFVTGDPTLTFRSEAKLTPDPDVLLNFEPGTVTQVPHTATLGGFWGIPAYTYTYYTDEITGAKITRNDGSWLDEGFVAGQTINVGGAVSSRGTYKIREVTDTAITLENGYQVAQENAVPSAVVLMTADLADSIQRDGGNWRDDGFREGYSIKITGSDQNDGVYRIKSISQDGRALTLTTNAALTGETSLGCDVSVAPDVSMIGAPELNFNTEAYFLGGANLTFTPILDPNTGKSIEGTITRDAGKWGTDGFLPGYNIHVYSSAGNDGEYKVLSLTDDTLTVRRTGGGDIQSEANISPLIRQELPDTITRKSGNWFADGFLADQRIRITNSLLNDGTYRVWSISPDGKVLTLNPDRDGDGNADDLNQLTNDASDTGVTITAVGEGVGGLAGDLTVVALQSLPSSGISAMADGSASSGSLLLSGAGTDNLSSNSSSVYAYVGSNATLRFTGNADVNAATFATQRTRSDGVSIGALAGGASLAEANSISDTQAYFESDVSVRGENLRIFAGGTDDSQAEWCDVGGGGALVGGDSDASTHTLSNARAYLAGNTTGQSAPFTVKSLEVTADHTSRFDSVSTSLQIQLAGASVANAVNIAESHVNAEIGHDLAIQAEDITVRAMNRTDKPPRDGANLRGISGGLVNAPLSNTSYTEFTSDTNVNVGDRTKLNTVSGDRQKPGTLRLLANNDINAWDYVEVDSGGAVALPIAFSLINGTANGAAVEVGENADLWSDGDIEMSARTDARMNARTQVSTYGLAGAGWGGSAAILNARNLVTVRDGADFDAGRNIYLLAGTERMGEINHFDLDAKTDIWNNTVVPLGPLGAGIASLLPGPTPAAENIMHSILASAGLEVPAEARLNLKNLVTVEPNVAMTGVGDAYFFTMEGDVEVTGKGKAKDLYSEILGALSGGALEWGGGRSIVDTVSGVEMNGSVDVGIRNKQRLTIEEDPTSTFDSYDSYKIDATVQDDGVSFTVREESLLLNLVNALERAQELRSQYDDFSPTNTPTEAAFDAEIARIEQQLIDMGFSSTTGAGTTSIEKNSLVRFIVVDPILAQSANVNIKGDYLVGEGSLKARGETEITIINNTQYYLRTNDLLIPEEAGGRIWVNNREISEVAQIENLNRKVPTQATLDLDLAPGTPPGTIPKPPIYIENQRGVREVSADLSLPAPDIELQGDILNLAGSLTVRSLGSITATGSIQADTIDLGAAGSFVQSYVDALYSVGGDPKSAYGQVVNYYEQKAAASNKSSVTRTQLGVNSTLEAQALQNLANQAATGGIIVGDNVFISARYLNINGKIQSGQPMQALLLTASLNTTIENLKAQYQGQLLSGQNPDPRISLNPWLPNTAYGSLSPVKAFYDYEDDRIELDPIVVKGGYIELVGEIISTGSGTIEVRNGYGNIDVKNDTSYDLLVQGVDVGTAAKGKLIITDLAASRLNIGVDKNGNPAALKTTFTGEGGSVQIEDNSPDQVTDPDGLVAAFLPAGATPAQYNPVTGVRYEWVRGQAFTVVEKVTYRSSSWLGVDALAKDPGNIYKTEVLFKDENKDGKPDLVPLLQGEYTRVDPGNTLQYDYSFQQVTTDQKKQVGEERRWDEKSGFWGLGRTYYCEVNYETGLKNFHKHSIKADKPITIQFIGASRGEVSIKSANNLLLGGAVKNAGGSTSLEAGWDSNPSDSKAPSAGAEIRVTSDTARITSEQVTLSARAGIGEDSPVRMDVKEGGWVSAFTNTGDIELVETSGDMTVGYIGTTGVGRVVLEADGGLMAHDGNSLVQGNKLELNAKSGGIGSNSQWLRVDSAVGIDHGENAGLAARATDDIYVKETEGDLYLLKAEAVDVDGNLSGDVSLWAEKGSIRDYRFDDEVREDTFNELLALADEVGLRGAKAQARAEANVAAFKASKEAEYHSYWGYRNQQRVTVNAAEGLSFSFNKADNTITRSSGTWVDDGFTDEFQTIYVSGSGQGNDGKYEMDHIDGATIWLKTETPLGADETDLAAGAKVIGEIPASLVTIELTAGQETYLRNKLGYNDDQVEAYETNLTDQYRYLDSIYANEGNYEDPNWTYTPSLEENAALRRGAEWDDDALTFGISPALFKKTSSVVDEEDPNIRAFNVDLRAFGGLGAYKASLAVDLSSGFSGLSDQEKVALAAAERDDVRYFGDDSALMEGNPTLNFDASNRAITRSSGSWVADGFEAAGKIWIEGGSANAGRAFQVKSVTATVMTLEETETLTGETGVQGLTVGQLGAELDQLSSASMSERPTLTFDASARTISRDDGSWLTDGFSTKKKIWVAGTAFNNGQAFLIESVSDRVITVSATTPVQDEVAAGARVGQILVARMTIEQREDVDVDVPGEIRAQVNRHLFLGSEIDINLDQVVAGEQMVLRTLKGILNAAESGQANIVTTGPEGNVVLEAGGGSIGAYLDQGDHLVVQPILVNLFDGAALSARTEGDIYITEAGDMYLGNIYAPNGLVELTTEGSIYDGLSNREVKIESPRLHLNAAGAIGTAEDFLEIDQILPGAQGSMGEAKIQAGGNIFLRDPVGSFYVDEIRSTGGDVSLEAAVSIVDAAGENNVADVIGRSITLNAKTGWIGQPFTGDLDVDTDSSNSGALTAYSAENAYLFEVDDDLLLKQVGTGEGKTAFIQSPGRILNGNPGGTNVASGAARLYAASDIGADGNPLSTQVGNLEGYSEAGEVWISNSGPLTVGGVSELEGINAVGGVVIKASSPVTVAETIQAADIVIIAGDSEDPGDDILVSKDVTLWSKEGKVSLKAGDNLSIEEGAIIQAATTVELFGDWSEGEDPDPGIGATIDPSGDFIAPSVLIFGGEDGDVVDLRHLDVDAAVSGGSGSDTLIGPDGDSIWEIKGPNSGELTNQDRKWTFESVENLTSGNGDDIFYFRGQGSVDGLVDGGAGFDLIDFLQSDFIQEAAASFQVTELPVGDVPVPFAKTGNIVRIEDIKVIILGEVQEDGTLVLNMGPRAAERLAINTEDGDEVFILTHVAGGPKDETGETIGVEAFGIYLEYEGVRAILGSGGLGDDTITLAGDILAPAELDGGSGDDLLVGGAGDDVLRGREGDDTLEGGAGNDVMDGGWGDDRYVIVPGSLDKVIDVQGVDSLDFSKVLLGVRVDLNKSWGQIQRIDSAGNKLRLYGMIENAVGSEFNDWIYGNCLNNRLEGLGGDDWLFGSYGNDTLEGGEGRDRLYGDWGNDRLAGGGGNDTIEGGYGEDLLFFPGALTGVTVNLTCGGNGWSSDGLGGVDTLRWSIEGAIGTEFEDTLVGDDSRNVFYGMAGDDFINSRGGDDVLYGGEGVDRIFAGWGNDLVVWAEGEGNDTIDMGDGWDRVRLTTGYGDDWVYLSSSAKNKVQIDGAGLTAWSLSVIKGDIFEIYTGGGADIVAVGNLWCTDVDEVDLYLGSGNDKVDGSDTSVTIKAYGQAGNDLFIGGWGHDTFDGGEGSDWVDYSSAPRRVHVDLAWGAAQDGKGSKDYLKAIENVIGTQFDDMIWGTDGANIIRALGGDDHVWARGGDDVVYGGDGDDKLWGDGGNDTLMGDAGNDMVWGGQGDDRLYGGSGNDRLWGDRGEDELYGDDGDDRLEGGDGDDRLEGGGGHDELDGGWGDDQLFGGIGNDKLEGGHGNDLLKGESGNDILDGGWGNDRLYGGTGDDRLYGGWGDDELFGEDGNDLLVGDHGNDKLDGGAGVNKLVDWPDKQKDCGDHGHGPFDKPTVSGCASWVNSFVTDLCKDLGKNNPNGKIQITLPAMEKEKPGVGCKGGKR